MTKNATNGHHTQNTNFTDPKYLRILLFPYSDQSNVYVILKLTNAC